MGPQKPKLEPKPGDQCEACVERKKPHTLVKLGYTQNKKLTVTVCPYCDGERAIDLSKAKK